ncbi:glycosyltransferase family 4 protein [Sinorhizobium sp. BG8]|uniref:glycosyltransferase family 4 protein n=1 Tax=Sinorhizobium sp. BG8 TaxID=2613773 RepID=UPI00193EA287|nr:glycosyltransferase family 4 protein [Sinorhizobium sp. BG8]QRM56453.1 glycosyltransferase [Sinorhizobium sp. BG8]
MPGRTQSGENGQERGAFAGRKVLYVCGQVGVPDEDRCRALMVAGADVRISSYLHSEDYRWTLDKDMQGRLTIRRPSQRWGRLGRLNSLLVLVDLCRFRPDICIVYGYQRISSFLAAVLSRILGAQAVSLNDSGFEDYRRFIVFDLPKLLLLAPYGGFLAATERARGYLHYFGKGNIALYRCAIDIERVRGDAGSPRVSYEERDFICVARFVKKKNLLFLLDAYEAFLLRSGSDRRLQLCGYGVEEPALRARIAQSALLRAQVDILGYVGSRELPALISASLALVLASSEEQFGIVAIEAWAVGVPVIVTRACGVSELVQGGLNGHLIDHRDPEPLIRALQLMASSEAHWQALRRGTVITAALADAPVFVDALLSVLRRAKGSGTVEERDDGERHPPFRYSASGSE